MVVFGIVRVYEIVRIVKVGSDFNRDVCVCAKNLSNWETRLRVDIQERSPKFQRISHQPPCEPIIKVCVKHAGHANRCPSDVPPSTGSKIHRNRNRMETTSSNVFASPNFSKSEQRVFSRHYDDDLSPAT